MLKPDGYATVVGDVMSKSPRLVDPHHKIAHTETEIDVFQCGHCQRIVHVPPKADPATVGGGCRICQRNICSRCVDLGVCSPWEEKIAAMEAKHAALRSYGLR